MRNFGYAAVVVGGLVAGVVGLAIPAAAAHSQTVVVKASVSNLNWLDEIHYQAKAPKVDTTVHQSR